jgi:hypothetical protein
MLTFNHLSISFFPMLYLTIFSLLLVALSECSNVGTVVFLKEAAATKGAVCLDGTPGAFYFRAGEGE